MGNCFQTEKKYTKAAIPSTFKSLVWDEYIGATRAQGPCYCCNRVIVRDPTKNKEQSFHCGHVTAERGGGELWLGNCRPICRFCNSSMGTTHMADYYRTLKHVDLGRLASLRASLPADPQTLERKQASREVLAYIADLALALVNVDALVPRVTHDKYVPPIVAERTQKILESMSIDDLHFLARSFTPCNRLSRQKLIAIITAGFFSDLSEKRQPLLEFKH